VLLVAREAFAGVRASGGVLALHRVVAAEAEVGRVGEQQLGTIRFVRTVALRALAARERRVDALRLSLLLLLVTLRARPLRILTEHPGYVRRMRVVARETLPLREWLVGGLRRPALFRMASDAERGARRLEETRG